MFRQYRPGLKLIAIACIVVIVCGLLTTRLPANLAQDLLYRGSQGPEVTKLQHTLQRQGYLEGEADGIYGRETQQAVRKMQKTAGIAVDGIVGPQTSSVLLKNSGNSSLGMSQAQATTVSEDSSDLALMPPDIQDILDRGTLRVALLGRDNPPFFRVDEDRGSRDEPLEGLDIAIASALAGELDVEVEFIRSAQTFDEVVELVYRREADLAISKLSQTLKRARRVRFSQPYVTMRQALLVNRLQLAKVSNGDTPAAAIRNFNGSMAVIEDSSYVNFTRERFPKATVVEYPTWKEAIAAVVSGEVVAAYRDELEVKKVALLQPDVALQLQTVALTDTKDAIAVAVPWSNTQLLAFVNQYFQTVDANYTADKVLEKYSDLLE
ncbi:MAG: transporter substrate-binding domain-containing protein [Jaaginema sp. PMC 1080.18]|nr:transporter substrate-binding domain-containing protein [Jaaginema sp. PMC 1080.18]MEC4865118.1 transporter substrate-binding domain-containing protein [Jaaginema sp. PMC 1078.18]